MKITPLDINQKVFEKKIRGYDKEEVNAFLNTLSTEWEKMLEENNELNIKLKSTKNEIEKLRDIEKSLFTTLKTAEETKISVVEQANKKAELHIKETEMRAEALLNDAKNKARALTEHAEMRAQNMENEMEDKLRAMAQLYKTLMNLKEDLFSYIKSYTQEILEKSNRINNQIKNIDIDDELSKIRKNEKTKDKTNEIELSIEESSKPVAPTISENKPSNEQMETSSEKEEKSFFDDLL